jgi:hypothetical protein
LSRGLPTKDFSGTLVEHFLISAELLIRDERQIGALGQSANECEGNRAVRDSGPIFDAAGLQGLGGIPGKKMGGKKCGEQKSPSFTAHFFAASAVSE